MQYLRGRNDSIVFRAVHEIEVIDTLELCRYLECFGFIKCLGVKRQLRIFQIPAEKFALSARNTGVFQRIVRLNRLGVVWVRAFSAIELVGLRNLICRTDNSSRTGRCQSGFRFRNFRLSLARRYRFFCLGDAGALGGAGTAALNSLPLTCLIGRNFRLVR